MKMAFKKTFKKKKTFTKRKKAYSKRKGKPSKKDDIKATPFPKQLYVNLTYGRTIQNLLIPASGKIDIFMLANGINPFNSDPGQLSPGAAPLSSVGVDTAIQPLVQTWQGLQVYKELYTKMQIISHKLVIKFLGDSVGAAGTYTNLQILVAAWPLDSQSQPNDLAAASTSQLMQQSGVQRRLLSPVGGKNFAKFSMARSTKKICGVNDIADVDSLICNINSTMTTASAVPPANVGPIRNPTRQWFYHIRVQNLNDNQDSQCSYSIFSSARARFFNRKLWVGQSTTNAPIGPIFQP